MYRRVHNAPDAQSRSPEWSWIAFVFDRFEGDDFHLISLTRLDPDNRTIRHSEIEWISERLPTRISIMGL